MMKDFNDGVFSLVCLMSLVLNWVLADHVRYSVIQGTYAEYLVYGIVGSLLFMAFVNICWLSVKIVKVFRYLVQKAEESANTNKKL